MKFIIEQNANGMYRIAKIHKVFGRDRQFYMTRDCYWGESDHLSLDVFDSDPRDAHLFPTYGKAVDAAAEYVDWCQRQNKAKQWSFVQQIELNMP
jgi:hypothetical protein